MSQQASTEFRAGRDMDEIRFVELFTSQIYVLIYSLKKKTKKKNKNKKKKKTHKIIPFFFLIEKNITSFFSIWK